MKSTFQHWFRRNRLSVILPAVGLVIAAVLIAVTYRPPEPRVITGRPPASTPAGQQTITVVGQSLCLPHTNTTGPQTDECAYGLKDDTGVYYALHDTTTGSSLISKAGFGKRVRVTGTYKAQTSATYPIIGIITLTAVEPE
ncbi:MAG TPA: hypothetical protein VMT30_05375 [Candidatus Saccharimonadia bacterium]|nr:hypothetical protein [Candidatus Saccharimonadia bacterium]